MRSVRKRGGDVWFYTCFQKKFVSVISLVLGGKFGVGFKGEEMSKVQVVVVRVLCR